ncbi:MAG: hypothetical protein AAGH90_08230 [Pseudomonadota bacterium]
MSVQALHFAAPTIEIVSESPRTEMLQTRLKQVGLRPIKAPQQIDPAFAAPILIDAAVISAHERHIIVSACERYNNRAIIILGERDSDRDHIVYLSSPDQMDTLPSRLDLRQRQLIQSREAALRKETIERLTGSSLHAHTPKTPVALFCGAHTPLFNALKNQLADEGIALKAALTQQAVAEAAKTLELSSLVFDVSNDDASVVQTLTHCAQTPGYTGLTKLVIVGRDQNNMTTMLADHIVQAERASDLAALIHKAAQRRATQLPYDAKIRDTATGLYTRAFLEAHVMSQINAADQTGHPLTVMGIELKDHLRGAKSTAAHVLKQLRVTDLAARYSARHIIISLPATAYRGAIKMARRLQADSPMIADINVLERRQFHTAKSLLSGLLARPDLTASKRA